MQYYLAIDIGASSGRHILGHIEDGKLVLEEVYRFDNRQVHKNGHDCWDIDNLWEGILGGLKACKLLGKIPTTVGIDTWAVDYVLLDKHELMIGDAVAYRDSRTEGMREQVNEIIPADVLYGKYNPAGRLPVTFYKDTLQLPDFQDYSMKGRTYRYMTEAPLYAFGYGLSYTDFSYGKAQLSEKKIKEGEGVTLTIPVSNVGQCNGDEVVQVYIRRTEDAEGPLKSLKGFHRVNLKAGQSKKVIFHLPAEAFETFDTQSNTMRILSGKYEIMYGGSSRDEDLQTLKLTIK